MLKVNPSKKNRVKLNLDKKQQQYRTSSSSILGIHVLIENWIFSVYQVLFLFLNDPQIEKIDYWFQKSATLWVCPLPKKKTKNGAACSATQTDEFLLLY